MKVLYISYDGMTDALGRSQVIPYLVGLSKKGHSIHIISCEKNHIPFEEKTEVDNILRDINIEWNPLRFSTRPPGLSKLFDVWNIRSEALKLHAKKNFDVVHCRSYIAALAGLTLKLKHGLKFVFDMRGFWANERIDGEMWSLSNPVYRIIYNYFKKKEKLFFVHADAVVSLTYNGKGVIGELFGQDVASKTTVIPCCVDTDFFSRENISPLQARELKKSLGFDDGDFIVSYLGSIGTWYLTDEMMKFFGEILKKYSTARFLIISGDDPVFIHKKAAMHDIPADRIVVSRATRSQVPLYLSLSAVSIFFIKPVFSKRASSPTKQAEIMSMGIPLICNSGVGDTDLIFADDKAGIVLKDFSPEEFRSAVDSIDSILEYDPAAIRQKALQHFNLQDGVEKYDAIYRQISGNGVMR